MALSNAYQEAPQPFPTWYIRFALTVKRTGQSALDSGLAVWGSGLEVFALLVALSLQEATD